MHLSKLDKITGIYMEVPCSESSRGVIDSWKVTKVLIDWLGLRWNGGSIWLVDGLVQCNAAFGL